MNYEEIRYTITTSIEKAIGQILSLNNLTEIEKNEIFQYSSQLENIKKESRLNIISNEEKNLKTDKIRYNILEFLSRIGSDQNLKSQINSEVKNKKIDNIQSDLNKLKIYFELYSKWRSTQDGEGVVKNKINQFNFRFFQPTLSQEITILYDLSEETFFKYDYSLKYFEESNERNFEYKDFKHHEHTLVEIKVDRRDIEDVQVIESDTHQTLNDENVFLLRIFSKNLGQIFKKVSFMINRSYKYSDDGKIESISYSKEEGKSFEENIVYVDFYISSEFAYDLMKRLKELMKLIA